MDEWESAAHGLAGQVAALAMERGITLATAESCTAGLVSHLLGRTPGVSTVFLGGIVAYANEAKRNLLDVPAELLDRHGAVSEAVALAMARGARTRLSADLAVSTTGIAGPGGGSPEKPVGLVYIAVVSGQSEQCIRFQFAGDRQENIHASATSALTLLRAALMGINA
ncbi:MAG TPA: nicotinamide-nucleotide amidohydrolase family protein [Chloroflexota bacterium]|nr:nicotinamide-nucleotide amidohydrolase family protein [Chloroflexota bacterium]